MSLELAWPPDEALASSLLTSLNRALASAPRPSFLGPITLTALDFGAEAPCVDVVGVGDVWREFGESAAAGMAGAAGGAQGTTTRQTEAKGAHQASARDKLAKFAEAALPFAGGAAAAQVRSYRQAEGRLQRMHSGSESGIGLGGGAAGGSEWGGDSLLASQFPRHGLLPTPAPSAQTPGWSMPRAGLGVAALGPNTPLHTPPPGASGYFDRAAATPAQAPPQHQQQQQQQARHFSLSPPLELSPAPCESALPSLQLHLLLRWLSTSLRLTLHTSLLINHPAPAFLELPLDITLTSLELRAGAVVAFEETQEGRRLHLCLTEAMSDEELQAHSSSEDVEQEEGDERLDDIDASPPLLSTPPFATRHRHTPSSTTFAATNAHTTNAPPQTLGERLLPALTLESSVGQADKHTLLNVGKVEKFVAELLRKAVVEELVFPSAYTLEL